MLLEWLSIIGVRLRRKTPPAPRSSDRGMYQVTQLKTGRFTCWGMVQDGSERWEEKTPREAVDSMVRFAKVMNGMTITQGDISISCADPAYNSV